MAVTLPNGVVVPNADGKEQISATGIDELRVAGASADSAIGAARSFAAAQAAQAEQKALDATQVALDVDTHSRARDAALGDQIAGMEGMTYVGAWDPGRTYRINDVVTHGGDSWARLTAGSQGTPGGAPAHWGLVARRGAGGGFGELAETAVTGLWEGVDVGIAARLAALEYDSGLRDITALFSELTRGTITAQRLGRHITLNFYDVQIGAWTSGNVITLADRLPSGFRPPPGQFQAFATVSTARAAHWVRILPSGDIAIYYIDNTTRINGSTAYTTPDAAPTLPPGSAA